MGFDPNHWDFVGLGSPNGVVTANVNQTYLDNSATPVFYVKHTGNGTNTGWMSVTGPPGPVGSGISGVAVSGTPSAGEVLTATSPTAANWQPSSGGSGGGNEAFVPASYGLLAWNMDPFLFGFSGSAGTLSHGNPYLEAVPIASAISITNIGILRTAAGVSLSNCYMGIYDHSGTLLGHTADLSTPWMAALSTPGNDEYYPIAGGPLLITPTSSHDWIYVGLLSGDLSTTSPGFAHWGGSPQGQQLNIGGPNRSGYSNQVNSTSLPATVNVSTINHAAMGIWIGLS